MAGDGAPRIRDRLVDVLNRNGRIGSRMTVPNGTLTGAGCEIAEDSMWAYGPFSVM